MKKQIFIISALLIALSFTACEQEALLNPMEDNTMLLENDAQPPQEAVDALEVLIASDFAEDTERCNSWPGWGYIREVATASATNACGTSMRFRFGSSTGAKWFYYHVDQKQNPSSNYLLVTSSGGSAVQCTGSANITTPIFPGVDIPGTPAQYCGFRAYIYVWDAPCNKWQRLAYRTFN